LELADFAFTRKAWRNEFKESILYGSDRVNLPEFVGMAVNVCQRP
jgi:hypothetical protein